MSELEIGAMRFLFDDFGALDTDTLQTNAVPWKLVAAALLLHQKPEGPFTQTELRALLSEFGFLFPARIVNWPAAQPAMPEPLGITRGMVGRTLPRVAIETANLGCASCHAGVLYDANGIPGQDVWLGLPNTSLDLDSYVTAVIAALRHAVPQRERLFQVLRELFPEVSDTEIQSLRKWVWPRLVERLDDDEAALRFRNGGPGRSNGVEALRMRLHASDSHPPAPAGVSIPFIGNLSLRHALLADGIYTRPGEPRFGLRTTEHAGDPAEAAEIVGFFTVPTMGVHPRRAVNAIPPVGQALRFLASSEPPPFPGVIDVDAAARGERIYARCAGCHGEYVREGGRPRLRAFPNRLSTLEEIGTDPSRAEAVDETLLRAIERSSLARYIVPHRTGGYVAPPLQAIWATAPYLHNGSVPTLAALMTPEERPAKFLVGGHRLDFVRVGVAEQPAHHVPWATSKWFDTSLPGNSNRGHEKEFEGLSAAEKADLIEFLKEL
jgi:hypothetical protein